MSTNQTQSAASPHALSFTPVPVRPRHDGWTPERQTRFIAVLAATGCVMQAARDVGMSTRAAYDLYNRTDAASFRAAWDAALTHLIGRPRERRPPQPVTVFADDPAVTVTAERVRQVRRKLEQEADNAALVKRMELIGRGEIDPNDPASYTRWQERKRRASAERHAAVARPLDSGTDAP